MCKEGETMPSITSICKFNRVLCDFSFGLCHLSPQSLIPAACVAKPAKTEVFWRLEFAQALKYKGWLPAEGFLEKGNGELALGLQRGLVELFEQIEQCAHAACATGEDEVADFVGQVQAATRGAQLQGA